jgi:hypothetical protein
MTVPLDHDDPIPGCDVSSPFKLNGSESKVRKGDGWWRPSLAVKPLGVELYGFEVLGSEVGV